jgi:hypothetical protein
MPSWRSTCCACWRIGCAARSKRSDGIARFDRPAAAGDAARPRLAARRDGSAGWQNGFGRRPPGAVRGAAGDVQLTSTSAVLGCIRPPDDPLPRSDGGGITPVRRSPLEDSPSAHVIGTQRSGTRDTRGRGKIAADPTDARPRHAGMVRVAAALRVLPVAGCACLSAADAPDRFAAVPVARRLADVPKAALDPSPTLRPPSRDASRCVEITSARPFRLRSRLPRRAARAARRARSRRRIPSSTRRVAVPRGRSRTRYIEGVGRVWSVRAGADPSWRAPRC